MARRRISRRSSRGRKPRRAMPAKVRRLSGAAVTVVALLGIGIILGFALAVGMGHRAEQTWLASGIRHAASPTKVARTTPAPAAMPAAKVAPPAFVAKPAPVPVAPAAPTPPYVSAPPVAVPSPVVPPVETRIGPPEAAPPIAVPMQATTPPPDRSGIVALAKPSASVPVALTVPNLRAPTAEAPAWRRFAVAATDPGGRPMIAIMIDDLGINRRNTARVMQLPAPLTLAFMTYAEDLDRQSAVAHDHGHELMLHMPMEPIDRGVDAGPNVLAVELTHEELRRRLLWGLDRLHGYVGVNNHMGSRFTASEPGMAMVMEELKRRGLLFVDSRTTSGTVGDRLAERFDVPHADRDVFLDNDEDGAAVLERLAQLEAVARRHGMAIGIGHPHDGTIAALAEWLPTLKQKGFVLVPVSAIVMRQTEQRTHKPIAIAAPPS